LGRSGRAVASFTASKKRRTGVGQRRTGGTKRTSSSAQRRATAEGGAGERAVLSPIGDRR